MIEPPMPRSIIERPTSFVSSNTDVRSASIMACKQFDTAVEINCRPERLDPPRRLLKLAVEFGCRFSIDSDAHAPGQLDWQPHGCERAAECEVPLESIVNTMAANDLVDWASSHA